ncbi:MAG: hypothetical protein JW891_11495 [Candidatus Lokiarchaeota archaeon]|nr:hypothetical protein [Candidatus Lokiarchaeota archaeon]
MMETWKELKNVLINYKTGNYQHRSYCSEADVTKALDEKKILYFQV